MVDYIATFVDVALAVLTFVGTYYAYVASRLFRGDPIMERMWRLVTAAFIFVAFFSVLDLILTVASNPLVGLHLVRIAAILALGIFVFAVMMLVRWGKSSMELRTQPSRQYPQR